jgi:hypothetical protein
LPNADFIEIASFGNHSLGLKSDSTIVAWGDNYYGQCNVSEPNDSFVMVGAGGGHSLGLKSGGTIVAWGRNNNGECNVPAPNEDFVAVGSGVYHSLGLKTDGTIVAWGSNNYGQCNVPAPNEGFIAVAGGYAHSLGLKADGTIVAWGSNSYGQCIIPAPNEGFEAIACGAYQSLGLKSDGTISAWGMNEYGQCDIPSMNEDFTSVTAGYHHTLGLKRGDIVAVAFSSFIADSREGGIVLHWEVEADESLNGFRLYRAEARGEFFCITDCPLSPSVRTYEDRTIEPGVEYRYMVGILTADGREIRSLEVAACSGAMPLALDQNVPNPFNPRTSIGFSVPGSEQVGIDIYDPTGRLVRRLIDKPMDTGRYDVEWDGRDNNGRTVASGVYFYRLTVGKQTSTKKMILLR